MIEQTEKKDIPFKKKLLVAGLGFLFLVLLITSFFGKKGVIEIYRAKRNNKALLQEIERLKEKKSSLERDIEELEKNPRAVDMEAREKLWLIRPDEKVIVKKNK